LSLSVRPVVGRRAKISALGTYVPPDVITNQDLERMVETSDQWITERTGIKTRHKLAPNVWGFDVSAGCSGFVYALQAGAAMIESGMHSRVLVCGADANTRMTDYTDRATCVLFGDGGGAVLLEPAAEGEIGFIDGVNQIDGAGGVSLYMPGGGSLNPSTRETVDKKMHYIHQDGPAVYKFAVRKMAELTAALLERNGVTGSDLGCFIPHQANKRIIESTADRLGMPPERVILNIDKYGNTSSGTIPLAMETAIEEGKLKKGDLVLLAAVGAGFTVGTVLLRWEI